ncbi:MAG: hypothetical protein IJV58_05630 [Oscillospiraceae bacterium]|nr:hypothetical protein [Oscillospiraceae bacterium]
MKYEDGQWYMQGVSRSHPDRLKSPEELLAYVDRVGFLPLFGIFLRRPSSTCHAS